MESTHSTTWKEVRIFVFLIILLWVAKHLDLSIRILPLQPHLRSHQDFRHLLRRIILSILVSTRPWENKNFHISPQHHLLLLVHRLEIVILNYMLFTQLKDRIATILQFYHYRIINQMLYRYSGTYLNKPNIKSFEKNTTFIICLRVLPFRRSFLRERFHSFFLIIECKHWTKEPSFKF